ncbi:MAG TPA: peroxiredoxin [Acidimicrobiales bacterium]|nr:peroxiredoxin [Acidimicrobiales bacterium]
MSVAVGDRAPHFSLASTGGKVCTLDGFRGGPVVLVFYPGANTPVCTTQLRSYSEDIDDFTDLGAAVLAISPQGIDSQEAFADKHGFAFPLLADADKSVGEAYGVLGPLGFYRRSIFVVDGDGVIRYAHRAIAGLTFRKTDELVAAVRDAS